MKAPILLTFLVGLILTAFLVTKRITGGIVIGIIITTFLTIPVVRWWGDASAVNFGQKILVNWKGLLASPDFSLLFQLALMGSLSLSLLPVIFAFTFTDLFDSLSTFVGVAEAADLYDANGDPRNIKQSLLTDAVATVLPPKGITI